MAKQFVELLVVGVENMPDHLFYAELADGSGFPFSMTSIPKKLEGGMKVRIDFAPTKLQLGLYSVTVFNQDNKLVGQFPLRQLDYHNEPLPQII